MRFQYRLRTALIAVVVLSPVFALLGPFFRYHAAAYESYSDYASDCRRAIVGYQEHSAPGHSCPFCRRYYRRPVDVLIASAQRQLRENERKARWHYLLSGPYYWLFGGERRDNEK